MAGRVKGERCGIVGIRGRCPNLASEGCAGPKPPACYEFQFGGKECNRLRREAGLRPVSPDGEIIIRRRLFSKRF